MAWGGYHGLWLVVERAAGKRAWYSMMPLFVRIGITFVLCLFGLVLFRSDNMEHAARYAGTMVGFGDGSAMRWLRPGPWAELILCAIIIWAAPTSQHLAWHARPRFVLFLQVAFVLAVLVVRLAPDDIPFLYFRF